MPTLLPWQGPNFTEKDVKVKQQHDSVTINLNCHHYSNNPPSYRKELNGTSGLRLVAYNYCSSCGVKLSVQKNVTNKDYEDAKRVNKHFWIDELTKDWYVHWGPRRGKYRKKV